MATSNPIDDFRHLLRATKIISSTLSLDEQLPPLMDAVIALTGADKAMLILADNGKLEVKAERALRPDSQSSSKFSSSVIEQVLSTGQPQFVLAEDLSEKMSTSVSMQALKLRTVMCTPLTTPSGILGALYAHSTTPLKAFDTHKKEIFVALCEHAAVAIHNARLFAASISDPMTGLYNHAYCMRRLKEEVERAERYQRALTFVLLDVDHFKQINDTYGHRRGDDVVRAVAETLRSSVRSVDIAARYGGDEFALLLPETQDQVPGAGISGATLLAERIRERIAALKIGDVPSVTSSIGVASLERSDPAMAPETLVERADIALYASKRAGRNKVSVFGNS